MKNLVNKLKQNFHYIVPSLIVVLFLLVLFAIEGIMPFGNNTVCSGDNLIRGMSEIDFWLKLMQGKANLFWDYSMGMGTNIYAYMVFLGKFSPFSIFTPLFNAQNIAGYWSLNLILKVAFMALTAYIFFNKIFKSADRFWKYAFSVMYGLSGYVLMNYGNTHFLEIAILFPIFLLALKQMFDDNKCILYIIVLTAMLIINFYISWMILFFIIFVCPVGIIFYAKKENRKKIAMNLLLCTAFSLMLSCITFLPTFLTVKFDSYRMSGEIVNTVKNDGWGFKLVCFFFASIPIVRIYKIFV